MTNKNILVCDQCGEACGCRHVNDADFNMEPREQYEKMRQIIFAMTVGAALALGVVLGWIFL